MEVAREKTKGDASPVRELPDLIVRLDISPQVLTNWKRRGVSKEGAIKAEAEFGCSVQYVLEGVQGGTENEEYDLNTPMFSRAPAPPPKGVGQSVAHFKSHQAVDDLPTLQWGDLVLEPVPEAFKLVMPDNSMAPRAPLGTVVHFRRSSEAKQGAGVLVRDAAGNFYFRRIQQRTPSHWRALAVNEDAAGALDSITDALTIVAVMTAIETDWSES